jgi:hypothetical protein
MSTCRLGSIFKYEHPTLPVWQSVKGIGGHDASGIREMEHARILQGEHEGK